MLGISQPIWRNLKKEKRKVVQKIFLGKMRGEK